MDIDFESTEIIFIYGYFKKKIRELELIKASPNCPIDKNSINSDISLYSSITEKLARSKPELLKLDNLM